MKKNLQIETSAQSEHLERMTLPADWRLLEEINDRLVLRRWIEARRALGFVAPALSILTLSVFMARIWGNPVLKPAWGLDWALLVVVPAVIWLDGLAIWSRWGSETWHFELGAVTRTRTILGKSWVRRFGQGTFELDSSCGTGGGSESRFRLWLRASNKRISIAEDRFDQNVRAMGLRLSRVTGYPITTVN